MLLAVLGASDWVDGWIARHFDQGSDLGKVLDPVADRVLLLVAAVALLVDGSVPARGRRARARPRGGRSASRCSCSRPPARAASTCSGSGKAGTLAADVRVPAVPAGRRHPRRHDVVLAAAWFMAVRKASAALRSTRSRRRTSSQEVGEGGHDRGSRGRDRRGLRNLFRQGRPVGGIAIQPDFGAVGRVGTLAQGSAESFRGGRILCPRSSVLRRRRADHGRAPSRPERRGRRSARTAQSCRDAARRRRRKSTARIRSGSRHEPRTMQTVLHRGREGTSAHRRTE